MISQRARYALRALIALAKTDPKAPLLISGIATSERIPRKFLEQILLELKHYGLVVSRRGKLGGYALLRPASQITFGQVLRLVDGPMAPLPCLSMTAYRRCSDCRDEETCEIRRVFAQVVAAERAVLDKTTIADALSAEAASAAPLPVSPQTPTEI